MLSDFTLRRNQEMPNIELHGDGKVWEKLTDLAIQNALRDTAYAGKVVVTTYSTEVHDLNRTKVRFLRILLTEKAMPDLKEIVALLRQAKVNEEIEVLKMEEFIGAED
jgi:hypothetical protein